MDAGLWEGGTFHVYGLGNFGDGISPTQLIGDIQATSNIEAPETFKLYELWYSQNLFQDKLNILIGMHDYNSEFDVMEYAGVLPNSSFGIAPNISQAGPSIFPTTALGLRIPVNYDETAPYLLAAAYDGVPGDPDDEKSSAVLFENGDGVFTAAEIGIQAVEGSAYYKLAIGGWMLTADTEDLNGVEKDSNGGGYLIGEMSLFRELDSKQGLGAFVQIGNAAEDRNAVAYSLIGGFNYTGLIPGRDGDVLAFGFCRAVLSDHLPPAEEGQEWPDAETVIELVYEAGLTPWFVMKPDVQYVFNPASTPGLRDALQAGVRFEILF